MSAATDYFTTAAPLWTGTVGSGGFTSGATTLPLSSTTGLTNGEVYYATVDRVDANGTSTPSLRTVYKGLLSGTNLINCSVVEGSDQNHAAGKVVEILFTAAQWNDLKTGLEVEHNATGTHKSALVTTLKAAGSDITTGTSDVTIVTPKAIKDAADGLISLTDVTTNDVSTTKHGFVPKAPNDTTKFLRGDATWGTISTGTGTTGIIPLVLVPANGFTSGANNSYYVFTYNVGIMFQAQTTAANMARAHGVKLPADVDLTKNLIFKYNADISSNGNATPTALIGYMRDGAIAAFASYNNTDLSAVALTTTVAEKTLATIAGSNWNSGDEVVLALAMKSSANVTVRAIWIEYTKL